MSMGECPVNGIFSNQCFARARGGAHHHRMALVEGIDRLQLEGIEGEGEQLIEGRHLSWIPGQILHRLWSTDLGRTFWGRRRIRWSVGTGGLHHPILWAAQQAKWSECNCPGGAFRVARDPLDSIQQALGRVPEQRQRRLRMFRPGPGATLLTGEAGRHQGSLLDLASNDYLGLSAHPNLKAAAMAAIQSEGVGSGGSRLVSGTRPCHISLEAALAQWLGRQRVLLFPSGFQANLAGCWRWPIATVR